MPSTQDCNVYLGLDKNVPFYVGIGGNKRLRVTKRNKWATKRRKQAEIEGNFRQDVILSGSRSACCSTEKLLIAAYGSVVNGGLLFNFTPGGDGGLDKSLLPPESLERIVSGGAKGAARAKDLGVGLWSPYMEQIRRQSGAQSGQRANESGQLKEARSKIDYSSMAEAMKTRGRLMGESNKGKISITDGLSTKLIAREETIPEGWQRGDAGGKRQGALKASLTLWEDPDHPEIGCHNAGNLVRRQKACELPHSKENRRKVHVHS